MRTSRQIQQYVFQAFVGLVLLVNGGLTFIFGGTYGGDVFPTELPNLSFLLGGLMLVIFYDVAAGAWFQARSREGQSNQQRAIASILAVCSMLASVSVSAIQLLMTTTLVDLSTWHAGVGVLGLIILVLMASAHFIGLFAYKYCDPVYVEQDAEAELTAEMQTLRLEQKRRVMQLTVSRAEALMLDEVDWLAESEAETAVRQLLADIRKTPNLPSSALPKAPRIIDGESVTSATEPQSEPEVFPATDGGMPRRSEENEDIEVGQLPIDEPIDAGKVPVSTDSTAVSGGLMGEGATPANFSQNGAGG